VSASDLTEPEFLALLAEELAGLDPDVQAVYERYRVPPRRTTFTWDWGRGPVSKPIWIIASAGTAVVGYDEVEEEYGTGTLRGESEVADWGTYGDRLRWTLLHFPGAPD
jgi:hypothetical protein